MRRSSRLKSKTVSTANSTQEKIDDEVEIVGSEVRGSVTKAKKSKQNEKRKDAERSHFLEESKAKTSINSAAKSLKNPKKNKQTNSAESILERGSPSAQKMKMTKLVDTDNDSNIEDTKITEIEVCESVANALQKCDGFTDEKKKIDADIPCESSNTQVLFSKTTPKHARGRQKLVISKRSSKKTSELDIVEEVKSAVSDNIEKSSNVKKDGILPDISNKGFKCLLDMSKYENLFSKKAENLSELSQTSLALKKHFPFKDYLREKLHQTDNSSKIDSFGLDELQLTSINTPKENEVTSTLKLDIDTSDLYFEKTDKKQGNQKDLEQIMKRSVLPADLERGEKAPKLFESEYKKKLLKKKRSEETAGKDWYNMPKTEMTEEMKRDIQLIKMRNVLDSKRHYKRNDSSKLPKYFQVGTVVEGAHEFYSTRVPKKHRKRTMVDELLEDADLRRRNKKKMIEIQKKQMSGGKGHFKKLKNKKKPTWARK